MATAEEILKDLKAQERKAKIDKWFEEYIATQKAKNERIESMMSSPDYTEWLNQFTKDKNGFFDDDWLYSPEKISQSDKENVEQLGLFYEGIDKYARENHIYPTSCSFGNFYTVRLNDFGFEVGILMGQGTTFFFNKAPLEYNKEFIDFNDIMTGKKQNSVDQINATLDSLSNKVTAAYESGVPIEAIVNTLDDTIRKLTSKNEAKPKTYVKNRNS